MSDLFKSVVLILIFPGFLFSAFMGFFLSGIDRKVVAKFQRRVGPPVLQPLYDFLKLLGKENIIPRRASKKVFILAPLLGVISVVTIALFVPIFGYNFKPDTADMIVIIYLLTIPAVAMIIGGSASGSPFAGVGISREMVTMLSYELPLVIVLLAVGAKAGFNIDGKVTFSLVKIQQYQAINGIMLSKLALIPAALAFLIVIPAEVGSVPFDVAEAETEICEGPLVEYNGLYLAMYKLTQHIKMFVMSALFVALFMGGKGFGSITSIYALDLILNLILFILLCVLVTIISISFVRAITGRIKIEQTLKFFWTVPTALALFSMILVYFKL